MPYTIHIPNEVTQLMSENMSYSAVLHEMRDLQAKWREQTYVLSAEDQERYDLLLQVRRARITQLTADGRVYVGPIQSK